MSVLVAIFDDRELSCGVGRYAMIILCSLVLALLFAMLCLCNCGGLRGAYQRRNSHWYGADVQVQCMPKRKLEAGLESLNEGSATSLHCSALAIRSYAVSSLRGLFL